MEITKKVILAKREEISSEWEKHKKINSKISEEFQRSLKTYDEKLYLEDIDPVTTERIYYNDELHAVQIPYGPNTTLQKSGCAIYCLEHALSAKGENINIAQLAEEAYQKGYLCEVKKDDGVLEIRGTYHNLFDLYKSGFCNRAIKYQEVFDNLKAGKIVTLLVDNQKYHNDPSKTGAHFINVIGKKGNLLIIEDSNSRERVEKDCLQVFKSTNVAWLWL